jgi:hypothetical protein
LVLRLVALAFLHDILVTGAAKLWSNAGNTEDRQGTPNGALAN